MRPSKHILRIALVLPGCAIAFAFTASQPPAPAATQSSAASATPLQAGKGVYEQRCAYCHGASGRGDGPVAAVLRPRPRDFSSGKFKLRTTPPGSLPADEDLERSIREGLPGTSMPAWRGVLSDGDIRAVVEYLKTFSPRFASETAPPVAPVLQVAASAESVARGKDVYSTLGCGACHGTDGRGRDAVASGLTDDWNRPIVATDLTEPWMFRGGSSATDVFKRLRTGMSGTPMPSFAEAASEEDLWHLANFVVSIVRKPVWDMTADEVKAFYERAAQEVREDPVEHGRRLVDVLQCGNCHTPVREDGSQIEELSLAGGMRMRLSPFMEVVSPNLTRDEATGLGAATDDQIRRAMTKGIRRDGTRMLPYPMPWTSFASLTEDDLRAIVAYLRTVPPVVNRIPPPSRQPLPRYLWEKFKLLFLGIDPAQSIYPGNAGAQS